MGSEWCVQRSQLDIGTKQETLEVAVELKGDDLGRLFLEVRLVETLARMFQPKAAVYVSANYVFLNVTHYMRLF